MAEIRKFVITPGKPFLIDPYEGEPFEVQLAGAPRQWRMTFGTTPAGDAIYFRDGFGPMEFTPDNLRGLTEGDGYDANAQVPVGGDIIVLSTGRFTKRPSITGPAGPGTFFLIGAQHFRTMTQGEYDALGAYDPDTIYMIEDPPGRIVRIYRGEVLHRDDTVQPGDSWTPILTENADGTITLSAENNVVTSGEYVLYTVADPVGTLYQSELPIVLAGVTIADEPRVALPPKVAELFPPLEFLGLAPVTATALEGETIYVQLTGSVDGGKEPYDFSDASLGSINETVLAIPQGVFDGQVTFTITDARNQSIEGFVEVAITAGASAVTAALSPSVSRLYRGQTLSESEFFAQMTDLANYENAASIKSITYQGVADASTPIGTGTAVGFTVTVTNYLGEDFEFKTALRTVEFDVRVDKIEGNLAQLTVNDIVPDAETITFEIANDSDTRFDGIYTKTAAELRGGPLALVPPEIYGQDGEEVGDLLQSRPGFFTSPNGLLTRSRQWLRDSSAIAGQTDSNFAISSADSGKTVAMTETGTDGVNAPASATSNGIAIAAAAVSNKSVTEVGTPFYSSYNGSEPITFDVDCGAAEAGKYLFVEMGWSEAAAIAGYPTATIDGQWYTGSGGVYEGSVGIVVMRWGVSDGGVKTITMSVGSNWRGHSRRVFLAKGFTSNFELNSDKAISHVPMDMSGEVQAGDFIYGMGISREGGTTGAFDLVGLDLIAKAATHNTKRNEHYEARPDTTGFREMGFTPTGDGFSTIVGLTWGIR